jgi:hypothetical protein
MQHSIGVKVMQPDFLLLLQAQQEGMGRMPETPRVEDAEGDHLVKA